MLRAPAFHQTTGEGDRARDKSPRVEHSTSSLADAQACTDLYGPTRSRELSSVPRGDGCVCGQVVVVLVMFVVGDVGVDVVEEAAEKQGAG